LYTLLIYTIVFWLKINIIYLNWKYINIYKFKIVKTEKSESTNDFAASKLMAYNGIIKMHTNIQHLVLIYTIGQL
jgi:hypothetical protein